MRASTSAALALSILCCLDVCAQQRQQASYIPPKLTLEQLMESDPILNPTNLYTLAADPAKLRATLEQQATSGNLTAQLLLGESYIPRECTFLPYKTAPADCPDDPEPNNLLGITRSFETAIHWLTLASNQGSGEASEILAQVIERRIKSATPTHYESADAARYHALARTQGYNLQDLDYACYTLDFTHPSDRLITSRMPGEFQLTPDQLGALQKAGAAGTLEWHSSSIQPGLTTLVGHPEGPKVHIRIVLTSPLTHETFVAMPDHTDVTYLQLADRILSIPAIYPTLKRTIVFRPIPVEGGAAAALQQIDGNFAGGCMPAISPAPDQP